MGYHQKGLCKGYVLEWNVAQNLYIHNYTWELIIRYLSQLWIQS